MKKKFFIAVVVSYHGDGILWMRLYNTDKSRNEIEVMAKQEMEADNWYIGNGCFLKIWDRNCQTV